jgi:hypothetical protein
MHKRLCACGCGERVTRQVEERHMNALTPALLTSQVLNQNRRSIHRKKRSQAIGFPARVRQQLAMGNTTEIDAPLAGPSNSSSLLDPPDEDIVMDHSAPSMSPEPLPDDDADAGMDMGENLDGEVYGLSNLRRSRRLADGVEKIGQQRWGSNASAHFVINGEESDEEEEKDEEDDEPISDIDFDIASDDDDDDEMFAGPGQEGLSFWDSLGEGFLREASQLRMSFS